MASSDSREVRDLVRSARALVEWEQELSGLGLPPVPVTATAQVERPAAAASRTAAPSGAAAPSQASAPARAQESEAKAPSPAPPEEGSLAILAQEASSCTACRLHEGRTRSVFARGEPSAELMFIGEGPGYHEDQQGLPFVGQAGALLDKMISAMGLRPDEVYICNVVKCRPPNNRAPMPDEAGACARFLDAQIAAVGPKALVALGRSAAERLGVVEPEGRGWRGRWASYREVPVLATYHPAYLLRTPQAKRQVWNDLKDVLRHLGRTPP